MKVKALNCPNCGASVVDNAVSCGHCRSRLKTMSCGNCFETIFEGSNYCPLCGNKAVLPTSARELPSGSCPRCRSDLTLIEVDNVSLLECERCAGVWCDVDTFESICSEKEGQAAVIKRLGDIGGGEHPSEIRYVPCPSCGVLMNRSNFARISGIVIDSCKPHGVWFDAQELPNIVRFIQKGGLDLAREKEKLQINEERTRLKQEQFKASIDRLRSPATAEYKGSGSISVIREFIEFLLD